MRAEEIKSHMRVCSRHFPDGDASKHPNPTLGKRLSSPINKREPRAKRARKREQNRQLSSPTPTGSRPDSISISPTPTGSTPDSPVQQHALLTTPVGEQLQSDYSVHELPSECAQPSTSHMASSERDAVVDRALLARIEFLEAENASLNQKITSNHFRLEQMQHDNRLVRFYTGFISFAAFFDFLLTI